MIQRIQTLYLLIATALMSVTIFTPMARFFDGVQEYTLSAFALKDAAGAVAQPTLYMGILLALAGVLPFVVIFLFTQFSQLHLLERLFLPLAGLGTCVRHQLSIHGKICLGSPCFIPWSPSLPVPGPRCSNDGEF